LAKVIEQGSEERSRVMLIIGCDFHSRFQQIAMLDPTTGEIIERRSEHENGEAKMFYAMLPRPARVGMEATCDAPWFERVLQEHHHELWIGDAAQIRAAMVRKQKTDSRDALHILDLLCTNRFPRIWVPSLAERDLRQMLRHRHTLVHFRTSVMNQLHALAMGQGLCRRKKLWAKARNWKAWSSILGRACGEMSCCSCSISSIRGSPSWMRRWPPKAVRKRSV
jgi:transposase